MKLDKPIKAKFCVGGVECDMDVTEIPDGMTPEEFKKALKENDGVITGLPFVKLKARRPGGPKRGR